MVFCGKCGTKNPDENRYCLGCGAVITSVVMEPMSEQPIAPAPEPMIETVQEAPEPARAEVHEPEPVVTKPRSAMTPAERRAYDSSPRGEPEGSNMELGVMVISSFLNLIFVAYLLFAMHLDVDVVAAGVTMGSDTGTLWDMFGGSMTPGFSIMFFIAIAGMVLPILSPLFTPLGLIGTFGCFCMANGGIVMDYGIDKLPEVSMMAPDAMTGIIMSLILCLTTTALSLWGYAAVSRDTGRRDPFLVMWGSH